MKDIRLNFLIGIFFFLLFYKGQGGCQELPPNDDRPFWQVVWSYTAGNDPTASALSINTGGWRDVYLNQANYNFRTVFVESAVTPSDASLDMSNSSLFRASVNEFITKFEENWGKQIEKLEIGSYFFGVRTMIGASTMVVGVTASKHFTQNDPAIAFVFTSKILSLSG